MRISKSAAATAHEPPAPVRSLSHLVPLLVLAVALAGACLSPERADADQPATVFPDAQWRTCAPADVGLEAEALDALARHIGGRGCVVRHGRLVYQWGDASRSSDVASAVKPVISTLLLCAVQDGLIESVDDHVAEWTPALGELNGGKDAAITWRGLASQTSGYGLRDAPGAAFAYNDFALALYYDSLMRRVYQRDGTDVLREKLAEPLGFQDPYTFNAFGPDDRPGRLAISVRDFARIGLLYLHDGQWGGRQLLRPDLAEMAIASPVPKELRRSTADEADMLAGQRSLGGGKNQAAIGPGVYSFNWWVNRTDADGNRLYRDAPADSFGAFGHGGQRGMWVFPSLDMIVTWNDSQIDDHDASLHSADSRFNQAARLVRDSVIRQTRVAIDGDRWLINGAVTYADAPAAGRLMNVRMVNAVFEDSARADFDPAANADRFIAQIPSYVASGVRAFTLNLQGGAPGYEGAVNSAFRPDGSLRTGYMRRVARVIEACDQAGAAVILGCFYQRQDQRLRDDDAVRAAVDNTAQWIKGTGFTNVALEIANEFSHEGFDRALIKSNAGQVELMGLARRVHPGLLVSTSDLGHGSIPPEAARAADFILIHFNGTPLDAIGPRIAALGGFGKPIVCNEDDKTGAAGAAAARLCVEHGASWGLMAEGVNQRFLFTFHGPHDDPTVYAAIRELCRPSGAPVVTD